MIWGDPDFRKPLHCECNTAMWDTQWRTIPKSSPFLWVKPSPNGRLVAVSYPQQFNFPALTMMESSFSKFVLLYGSRFPIWTPSASGSIQQKASCKCWKAEANQIHSLTSMVVNNGQCTLTFSGHLESIHCPARCTSQLNLRKETRKEVHRFNGAPHGGIAMLVALGDGDPVLENVALWGNIAVNYD